MRFHVRMRIGINHARELTYTFSQQIDQGIKATSKNSGPIPLLRISCHSACPREVGCTTRYQLFDVRAPIIVVSSAHCGPKLLPCHTSTTHATHPSGNALCTTVFLVLYASCFHLADKAFVTKDGLQKPLFTILSNQLLRLSEYVYFRA